MEHKCLSPWKGAVAGGLIAFAWSSISWMALPFHGKTLKNLADPAAVIKAVDGGAPETGVYLLMNDPKGQKAPTDPFIFLSYNAEGWGGMGPSMALGLLVQMIGGFFWTWILGKIPGLMTKDAALYGLFFGLCVGVLGVMPNWVWWKFPFDFTFWYIVDAAVSWTVASVVIGRWCQAAACALPAPGARP